MSKVHDPFSGGIKLGATTPSTLEEELKDYPRLPHEQKELIEKLEAYITKRELEARIEAYKHISLSDNGLQEPTKTWLEEYIITLTHEIERLK